jgi:putative salt-induced outer membrane protein YdiY
MLGRLLVWGLLGSLFLSRSIVAQDIAFEGPSLFSAPEVRRLPPIGYDIGPSEPISLLSGGQCEPEAAAPEHAVGESVATEAAKPGSGESTPGAPEAEAPAKTEPEIAEAAAKPEPAPDPWDGSFELGLDGSDGNSQRFNFRFGIDAKRTTKESVLTLDLDYRRNTNNSLETANRTFFDWRHEWLFDESPWTWFVHGAVDYDEFQAFDVRVSLDSGVGYQFLKTERTSLLGRAGGGWSREVGGPDDQYVPEAVFGADFKRQLSKRQKFTANIDYTPDVSDPIDFRLNTKANWEVLLDEDMNLSLKMSVTDRYDSTPHEAKANDVDYGITLLWTF